MDWSRRTPTPQHPEARNGAAAGNGGCGAKRPAYSFRRPYAVDYGLSPLASGLSPVAIGLWPVACGLWFVACGLCPVASGLWPVAYDLWPWLWPVAVTCIYIISLSLTVSVRSNSYHQSHEQTKLGKQKYDPQSTHLPILAMMFIPLENIWLNRPRKCLRIHLTSKSKQKLGSAPGWLHNLLEGS